MKGIYLQKNNKGNITHWVVSLTENKKINHKRFSVKEHGNEKAKELAINYRTILINNAKYQNKLKYEENLDVIFEDTEEYVEYKGNKILIDKEDMHLLDEYNWNYSKQNYLRTTIRLHMFIMNVKPKLNEELSIDHIDRNKLNITKSNLRLVNRTIQMINRKMKNNTSGIVGVYLNINRWVAEWRENKQKRTKSFAINKYGENEAKQMAIDYRNKMISEIEVYKIALCL